MSFDMARLFRRVQHAIRPARVSAPSTETGVVQRVQVRFNGVETRDLNSMQQYGLASALKPGADVMIINVSGDNANGAAIASNDQRYRPKGMVAGEVRVYNDAGSYIQIKGSEITIVAAGKVSIVSPEVTMSGKLTVAQDIVSTGGDVKAGTVSLKGHQHINSGGNGIGGPPQQ